MGSLRGSEGATGETAGIAGDKNCPARPTASAPAASKVPTARKSLTDASLVLTDDTDSFIIGDRVWVGGTKPGVISYIGETQFAPGEWAGVTLDEPIGKNDGSVAGVRYFQCEVRKGIFSRLTRLSRKPLTDADIELLAARASITAVDSSNGAHANTSSIAMPTVVRQASGSAPSTNGQPGINRPAATSPVGSTRKSPSPTPVLASSSQEFKLGDRVIINSTSGIKHGVLRHLGRADFADGVWAGVELDEPLGKNDGSVAGKRYFKCRPKYGLFAPVARVSKLYGSSSSRRGSSTLPPPRSSVTPIRRSGSRESLGTSSVASSTTSLRGTRRPSNTSSVTKAAGPSIKALQEGDDFGVDADGFY